MDFTVSVLRSPSGSISHQLDGNIPSSGMEYAYLLLYPLNVLFVFFFFIAGAYICTVC
jgi:hypothetical protein